jgi:hypothetical protein
MQMTLIHSMTGIVIIPMGFGYSPAKPSLIAGLSP